MFIIQLDSEDGFLIIRKDSFRATQKSSSATRFHTRGVANKYIYDLGIREKWPKAKVISWVK